MEGLQFCFLFLPYTAVPEELKFNLILITAVRRQLKFFVKQLVSVVVMF